MTVFFVYLILGCCAAFLSGMFGVGGGMIIVPSLLIVYSKFHVVDPSQLMHLTVGTSLATSVITLIFAVRAHQKHDAVRWPVVAKFAPGIVVGSLLVGPVVILFINSQYLKIVFSVFCLLVAAQILFKKQSKDVPENLPGNVLLSVLGLFTGTLSSLLGIAGGAISGAILNFYHMDIRKVIGTASAISFIIAVAGTIGLVFAGAHQTGLPKWSTGFIYWPALIGIAIPSPLFTPWGAALAHKLNMEILKKLFAVLLIVIAIKMVT